ncbi:hypothetical protein GGI42DRAFT_364234 [Trichoderma sp. SZMC 28013]
MMVKAIYTATLAAVLTGQAGLVQNVDVACRCLYGDRCWPFNQAWASLNNTLSRNLIKTVPACTFIHAKFYDSAFHTKFPGGFDFPHEWPCHVPRRNSSTCSLGDTAVYSINTTTLAAISVGLKFAARYNIRVSVKQSGHDLLGRFGGRGDVYPAAHDNGVVAVGGTCPTVGIIGGYLQGGGHGAAMHEYGLGSDQVLEFNALRGGGPSSYGIVTRATVSTYPEIPMVAFVLQITPQEGTDDLDTFLDAISTWYQQIPALLDSSVQGYARWAAGVFNQTLEQVQKTIEPIIEKLAVFKSWGIEISVDYLIFLDYYAYLTGLMHHDAEVGGAFSQFRQMVEGIAGLPGQNTLAVIDITSGGAAAKDLPLSEDVTYHKGKAQVAFAPDTGSYLNEGNWLDPDYLTNQFGAILPILEATKKKDDPADLFYCPTCVGSQHWEEEEDGHLCTVKGSWWPYTKPVNWVEEL